MLRTLETSWVPGVTVVVDHPDPESAADPGSWLEILATLFSFALDPETPQVSRVLLPGVGRASLEGMEHSTWQLIGLAFSPLVQRTGEMPGFLFYDDLASVPPTVWLGFERVITLQSTYEKDKVLVSFYC